MRRIFSVFLSAVGCLSLVVFALPMTARAAEVIDNFTTAQALSIPSGMTQSLSPGPLAGAGIVGGFRSTTLAGTAAINQSVGLATGFGFLVFSTGATSFGTAQLEYDGAGGGLGSALAGNEEITVSFLNLDLAAASSLDVTVTVTDSGSDTVSLTVTLVAGSVSPFDVVFDFGPSSGPGLGQLDFGDLASVTVDFGSNPQNSTGGGVDFILTGIMAQPSANTPPVPEPSSVAIWILLGAVTLGRRFARRRAPHNGDR